MKKVVLLFIVTLLLPISIVSAHEDSIPDKEKSYVTPRVFPTTPVIKPKKKPIIKNNGKTTSATTNDTNENIGDLDITYIQRTPRYDRYCVQYDGNNVPYRLCPGTADLKRFPNVGENVTYTAVVKNKGKAVTQPTRFQWKVDGDIKATGTIPTLQPDQETTQTYSMKWATQNSNVVFSVSPSDPDFVSENNSLSINSNDITIAIWVEQGQYNTLSAKMNPMGSYSFEDWIQYQFKALNERMAQAKYINSPDGAKATVRIDKIAIGDELDRDNSAMKRDPDMWLFDGRWQFVDSDPTNVSGNNGAYEQYANNYYNRVDIGLLHEILHQFGIIDLYQMNFGYGPNPAAPAVPWGIKIIKSDSSLLKLTDIKGLENSNGFAFTTRGIMGGGEIFPYKDESYLEDHTAAGINSHNQYRRGYYGEYLFDIPNTNFLRIVDSANQPVPNAEISLYQRDKQATYDNTPEITGTTNNQGIMQLPNLPVSTTFTTASGHTLKPNPWGTISVIGQNGVMIVKTVVNNQEYYNKILITDFNLEYWKGNTDTATYNIQTSIAGSSCVKKSKGDANCDNKINTIDFEIFRREYYKDVTTKQSDFNADNLIDLRDLAFIEQYFNK